MTVVTTTSAEIGVFVEFCANLRRIWFDYGDTERLILAIILAEFVCGVSAAIYAFLTRRRNLFAPWFACLPVLTATIGFGYSFSGFGQAVESLDAPYRFAKIFETARLVEVGLAVSALLFALNAFVFYRRKMNLAQ